MIDPRAIDPWRSHPATIVGIADEIPGVRTYTLALEHEETRHAYRFAPGQFNMLHLPGIGEAAISIASDRRRTETLAHTVRAVGNVTLALARLAEGDGVMLRGPFGTPWPLPPRSGGPAPLPPRSGGPAPLPPRSGGPGPLSPGDLVFVAGGLGLASQRAAILDVACRRDAFRRVVVVHGAKRPDGLLYAREHDAWRAADIEVVLVVDDPVAAAGRGEAATWRGEVGTVVTALERVEFDAACTTLLACGPDAMMAAVSRAAVARGIAAERVFLSLERNMACAVGHCGLCQFGPEFVCRDGPVLPLSRISKYLAVPRL